MTEKKSKRSVAIEIMKANATEPMGKVVSMIAKKIDVSEANAKSYYRWIVANAMGPGKVEAGKPAKAVKAVKAKKDAKAVTVARLAKEVVAKTTRPKVEKVVKAEKPAHELEEIRAKNLARLKAVASRSSFQAGQIANPIIESDGSIAVEHLHDSFKAPAYLTKADLDVIL